MTVNSPANYSREADAGQSEQEVEVKQGTDKPRNMPVVLIVSTVGAALSMWVIWTVFFA